MEISRQRLLDAAAMEFSQKGFNGANINEISLAAGLAKGTIYNYFESKHALMLALIAYAGELHVDYIRDKVLEVEDPKIRLDRFFNAGFDYVETNPVQARFLLTSLYSPDSEVTQAMYLVYQPLFLFVSEEIITPGINRGIFRKVNEIEVATLLMTIYLGTASNVDLNGKVYMNPQKVADFAFCALQRISNIKEAGE